MNESICSYSQGALQIASNEDEICKKSWNTPGLFWCFPPSPMSPKPAVNLFRGKIFPGPRTTKFPSSSIFPHPTFVLDTRPLTDFSLEPFLNLSLDRFTTRKNGPPLPSLLQLCVICSPAHSSPAYNFSVHCLAVLEVDVQSSPMEAYGSSDTSFPHPPSLNGFYFPQLIGQVSIGYRCV